MPRWLTAAHPLGFYELSDVGSCSLSASCTSVCSDRMYSSLGTLLPADPAARANAGDCRPRSADETTVHGAPLPAWRPPATEEGMSRPRPVSTGKGEPARGGGPMPGGEGGRAQSREALCTFGANPR